MADPDRVTASSDVSGPPEAPEVGRSLEMRPSTAVIAAVLAGIVGLALFGFFGKTRAHTAARGTALELSIDYPARMRYKQIDPLHVHVRNLTGETIDTVTVTFDATYLDPFSNVSFLPSATGVWEVRLTEVRPGERRRVQVGLQGERYGTHEGLVSAFFGGSDTVRAAVATLVFP